MTDNDDSLQNYGGDPEVSAHYRAFAQETTPNRLDKIVLRAASKAVRGGNQTGWGATWYRPVTFVATLGLSLALLLEISEFQFFDPPQDLSIQADAPADSSIFRDAADSAAISVREVDATADESLQLSSPGGNSTGATGNPALPAANARPCSDEQMAHPDKWWQCILELRESGNGTVAESELTNLQKSFPHYMPAK